MATKKQEKEARRQARLEAEKREAAAQRRRLMLAYGAAGVLGLIVLVAVVVLIARGGGGSDKINGKDIPAAAHVDVNSGEVPGSKGCPGGSLGKEACLQGIRFDDRTGTPPPPLKQGDLQKAAEVANCELHLNLPDEGNTHLQPDDPLPKYQTTPPTSGDHWPVPLADGAYLDPIPPIRYVHSLEHGRIEIHYNPKLSEKDQLALKGVFDEDPNGMIMFPDPDMPYDVAVTAWTNMVTCDKYTPAAIDVIRDFRDTYRGQGPEPIPL
jgi:Protein of unknown function (DUF3105)